MIHFAAVPVIKSINLKEAGGCVAALVGLAVADPSPYTPWILAVLVPIGLLIVGQLFLSSREKKKQVEENAKRLTILETQITPFWQSLQTKLGEALHHPHPESFEKDQLLEKLEKLTISPEERDRLNILLTAVAVNPALSTEERAQAKMLLLVMPVVTSERHELMADAAKVKADAVIEAIQTPIAAPPDLVLSAAAAVAPAPVKVELVSPNPPPVREV
jgi:hypothetical protein